MKFPTWLLWANSALFIVFGVCFVAAPGFFATLITGATPGTSSALIDLRATYGGMGLGIGVFFGFCARRGSAVQEGLFAALFVLGATAAARLAGLLADGSANVLMFLLLGAELMFVALIVAALRLLRRQSGANTRPIQGFNR